MPEKPNAEQPTTGKPNVEHVFWANELTRLAREQAQQKGVPDHIMAQAMMVQAWMLLTGQSQEEARRTVSGLYSASLQRQVLQGEGRESAGEGPSI
jgi:hypothetical protein